MLSDSYDVIKLSNTSKSIPVELVIRERNNVLNYSRNKLGNVIELVPNVDLQKMHHSMLYYYTILILYTFLTQNKLKQRAQVIQYVCPQIATLGLAFPFCIILMKIICKY